MYGQIFISHHAQLTKIGKIASEFKISSHATYQPVVSWPISMKFGHHIPLKLVQLLMVLSLISGFVSLRNCDFQIHGAELVEAIGLYVDLQYAERRAGISVGHSKTDSGKPRNKIFFKSFFLAKKSREIYRGMEHDRCKRALLSYVVHFLYSCFKCVFSLQKSEPILHC